MADVIVTGGAGFIGSNLVDALVARGDKVHVIDDLSTGKIENLDSALSAGADLHELDVRDQAAVSATFVATRPQLVFHLAAQIDVRRSVDDPVADAQINVLGALNVLEAARNCGVRRMVYSSTGGALYGDAEMLPTPEDHPIRPLAGYGQSKFAAEGYFDLFARLHRMSTVTLRYGNVYGPRQDVHGEAGVVAIFCGHLLNGTVPNVFGDGGQTRDWVDVADVVRANLIAADSTVGGALNIGQGLETSVDDLVNALREVGGGRGLTLAPAQYLDARAGEVRRSCLDVSRAKAQLGWESTMTLAEGLAAILDWLGVKAA